MCAHRFSSLLLLILATAFSSLSAQAAELDLGDVEERREMIPMRDGVRLASWIYLPKGRGPWPAIYEQRYADIRSERTRLESADFARQGYVVIVQNFRGAQESEGQFIAYRGLGLGEVQDGKDTIAWIVKQPWSDGKVGSYGASQGGYAQNFLAASEPEALAAQYMVDFGASLFHHGYRVGGAARPERFRGMCETAGAAEDGELVLAEHLRHPTYDEWWAIENTMPHFSKMDRPSFLIGSWFDRVALGVVDTFVGRSRHHPGKQQLILGPWVHGRYNKDAAKVGELTFPENSKFNVVEHQMKWFDRYLKGQQNGVDKDPAVRYYVMGPSGEEGAPGNYWREAESWPPESTATPYYLLDGGRLSSDSDARAKLAKTEWISDPRNPAVLEGRQPQSGLDQRRYESHLGVRTFTTEPLSEPVEWSGMIRAKLFVSTTAKDTDVIVRVTDVYPDGRSILLTDQVRRLRFRNGFDQEELLEPGDVYEVDFDIAWISQIFNAGHRIRITVASSGAPYWEVNPQTGEVIQADFPAEVFVARNAIHHDAERRSAVIAPLPARK